MFWILVISDWNMMANRFDALRTVDGAFGMDDTEEMMDRVMELSIQTHKEDEERRNRLMQIPHDSQQDQSIRGMERIGIIIGNPANNIKKIDYTVVSYTVYSVLWRMILQSQNVAY